MFHSPTNREFLADGWPYFGPDVLDLVGGVCITLLFQSDSDSSCFFDILGLMSTFVCCMLWSATPV